MDFNESKSAKCCKQALHDESITVVQYLLASRKAKKEGRQDLAELFEKMAINELEHAHIMHKFIHGELKDLKSILQDAAQIENRQWKNAYPEYANIAKAEGFDDIAETFTRIAAIENAHERDFTEAFLRFDEVQSTPELTESQANFVCFLCGKEANKALDICDVCGAENAFIPS